MASVETKLGVKRLKESFEENVKLGLYEPSYGDVWNFLNDRISGKLTRARAMKRHQLIKETK